MTDIAREMERFRKETQQDLEETIEDTIRQAWLPNSVAWIAVVVGAFALNLLLLAVLTGA